MKKFPVEDLLLSQIRLDPENVFSHSEEELERIARVVSEHGNLSVICVDAGSEKKEKVKKPDGKFAELSTYSLVGGEARVYAYRVTADNQAKAKEMTADGIDWPTIAEELHLTEQACKDLAESPPLESVPALMAKFDSQAQRDAASVALNAQFGAYDDDALDRLLVRIDEAGYPLAMTGLESYRYEDLIEKAPSLDDLEGKYGDEVDEAGNWPMFQMRMPGALKTRFEKTLERQKGEAVHEKLTAALDALDEAQGVEAPEMTDEEELAAAEAAIAG